MEQSIAEKIAAKLMTEHVTPEPEWKIRLEKVLYWTAALILILCSGILLSLVTLYLFQFFMPISYGHSGTPRPSFHFLAYTFPYVWLTLSGVAILLAIYVARKTPRGYRYKIGFLLTIAALSVSLFTLIFHLSHINKRAEHFINERVPERFHSMTENQWDHPEKGFLGGRIISKEEMSFDIEVRGGSTWKVITGDTTVFYDKEDMVEGSLVMISGQQQEKGVFMADTVKSTSMSRGLNEEYHPGEYKEKRGTEK